MNLPDFICIGVQRAGTTWLYECLKEHPEIFVPETKELHFFNDNYEKGMKFYSSFFEEADPVNQVIGELTPNYYHDLEALNRISKELPNVKIILILREPVARAYSHFQLSLTNQCNGMTFAEALVKRPIIKELSMQAQFVTRALELFDEESLHIALYDEIQNEPILFIKKIYTFLGVNSCFEPTNLNKRVNRIIFPRAQELLKKVGFSPLIEFIKLTPIGSFIKENHNTKEREKVVHSHEEYKPLFLDDIEEIEKILKIDLSKWKNSK